MCSVSASMETMKGTIWAHPYTAAAAASAMKIIPVLPSGRAQKDFSSSPRFVGVEGVMLMGPHPWRRLTYLAFS